MAAVWIIGGIYAFFANIVKRANIEKQLIDDPRFTSHFKTHTAQFAIPKVPTKWSSGWIWTGLVAAILGVMITSAGGEVTIVIGMAMITSGVALAVYDYRYDISKERQPPTDWLNEAIFQTDRLCLLYKTAGSKTYTFGLDASIKFSTRETFQDGAGYYGRNNVQILTGIGMFATFTNPSRSVELPLDFPGTAEFLAYCKHHGSKVEFLSTCDQRIVSRLLASQSWQANWQPNMTTDEKLEFESAISTEAISGQKPKLWNPQAAVIWSFLFSPAFGAWLHSTNWNELGEYQKAKCSKIWFYGYLIFCLVDVILENFFSAPEHLDLIFGFTVFAIWYFSSAREQVKYLKNRKIYYVKKSWGKPILTSAIILAAWFGLLTVFYDFNITTKIKAWSGDVEAQKTLVWFYYEGKGAGKDLNEAARWCQKAAQQGDADAQAALGECYFEGYGVPKNPIEAAKWYQAAADQGHAGAQYALGFCYANGRGVPADQVAAYAYLNLAKEIEVRARQDLSTIEKQMPADRIAAGQKRTKELQQQIEAKIAAKNAKK